MVCGLIATIFWVKLEYSLWTNTAVVSFPDHVSVLVLVWVWD